MLLHETSAYSSDKWVASVTAGLEVEVFKLYMPHKEKYRVL